MRDSFNIELHYNTVSSYIFIFISNKPSYKVKRIIILAFYIHSKNVSCYSQCGVGICVFYALDFCLVFKKLLSTYAQI